MHRRILELKAHSFISAIVRTSTWLRRKVLLGHTNAHVLFIVCVFNHMIIWYWLFSSDENTSQALSIFYSYLPYFFIFSWLQIPYIWTWYQFHLNFRVHHPEHVLSSMETIMALVIEESEDISMELLSPILASVKKDNEV